MTATVARWESAFGIGVNLVERPALANQHNFMLLSNTLEVIVFSRKLKAYQIK